MKTPRLSCKGCGSTSRKLRRPGPRCATCQRAERDRKRRAAFNLYLIKTYGITADEYDQIKAAQGGRCFWCRRATGAVKALAVDHDHDSGRVRGLLCGRCNSNLGHYRDDPEAIRRGATYVECPPAFAVIGERMVPNHEPRRRAAA